MDRKETIFEKMKSVTRGWITTTAFKVFLFGLGMKDKEFWRYAKEGKFVEQESL